MKPSTLPRALDARLADEQAELKRCFKALFIFVFGWPLIVGVVLWAGWVLLVPSPSVSAISHAMHESVVVVAFGYVIGFVPAALIGAIISGLQIKHCSFGFIHVLLIAIVVAVTFAGLRSGKDDYPDSVMQWTNAVIKLTAVLVATLSCWAIARRWRTTPEMAGG